MASRLKYSCFAQEFAKLKESTSRISLLSDKGSILLLFAKLSPKVSTNPVLSLFRRKIEHDYAIISPTTAPSECSPPLIRNWEKLNVTAFLTDSRPGLCKKTNACVSPWICSSGSHVVPTSWCSHTVVQSIHFHWIWQCSAPIHTSRHY